jgi:phage pi2 protein 07
MNCIYKSKSEQVVFENAIKKIGYMEAVNLINNLHQSNTDLTEEHVNQYVRQVDDIPAVNDVNSLMYWLSGKNADNDKVSRLANIKELVFRMARDGSGKFEYGGTNYTIADIGLYGAGNKVIDDSVNATINNISNQIVNYQNKHQQEIIDELVEFMNGERKISDMSPATQFWYNTVFNSDPFFDKSQYKRGGFSYYKAKDFQKINPAFQKVLDFMGKDFNAIIAYNQKRNTIKLIQVLLTAGLWLHVTTGFPIILKSVPSLN